MLSPRLLTRRQQLRILLPALAAGLSFKPRVFAASDSGAVHKPFTFIAVNDLHFLDADCRPWFEKVVLEMRRSAPGAAFCLVSGDLSDTGTAESSLAIRDILAGLEMPVHTVPGNHDHITQTDRSGYDAAFPGQLNYRFDHEGWQFIGLDSTEGKNASDTLISDRTLDWFEEEFPKFDRTKPTVAFTHFPLGQGVKMRPRNADMLLDALLDLNLRGVYGGHWHGASERAVGHATIVTDRCCSRIRNNHDNSPIKGWFVCEAAPDGTLTRRFAIAPPVEPVA